MHSRLGPRGHAVRKAVTALVLVGATLALGACGGGDDTEQSAASNSTTSSGKTVEWDMMVVQGKTGKGGVGDLLQNFADDVAAKTDGRLKITLRAPGEIPYTMDKLLGTVGAGRMEMGDAGIFSSGESKTVGIFGLPFLITTAEEHDKAVEALKPFLQKDFDKYGVTAPVFYYHQPAQTVWGQDDPPNALADLKGRQIRASSPEQAYLFQQLGAKPATLIATEVQPSLERNVIDSVASSGLNIDAQGWGEDLDWGYTTSLGYLTGQIVVNKKVMDELPADLKEGLMAAGADSQKEMFDYVDDAENKAREKLAGEGLELVDGDPGDEAAGTELMAPYWEKWAKENGQTEAVAAVRAALGR